MDEKIEDVVPAGTPDTVTLPVTGHVLALPAPTFETWPAYFWRVHRQCGYPDQGDDRGYMVAGGITFDVFSDVGGYDDTIRANWPEAADRHYNHEAYLSPAQKLSLDRAKAQWAAALANIGNPIGQAAPRVQHGDRIHKHRPGQAPEPPPSGGTTNGPDISQG